MSQPQEASDSPTRMSAADLHLVGEHPRSFLSFMNPLGLACINSSALTSCQPDATPELETRPITDDAKGVNLQGPEIQPPQPSVPDGGYGWVIVFASFLCNFIVDGIGNSFGVFLPYYVAAFGVSTGSVSWAGSLLCGGYLCMGPIVSGLTNKFGCRVVCITGAFVAATGLALSALANSLGVLILTYGVIGAIGFGMIYLPSVVCVGYYFERRRAFATGISVCGSGVGTFVFAPIAAYLLQIMAWERVNLIFAGVILLCAGCGSLMRPLVVEVTLENSDADKDLKDNQAKECESGYFMVHLPDGTVERRHKVPILPNNNTEASPNPVMDGNVPELSRVSLSAKVSTGSHSLFGRMGRSYSYRAVPLGYPGIPRSTSSSSNPPNVGRKSQLSLSQITGSKAKLSSTSGHNSTRETNTSRISNTADTQPPQILRPLSRKDIFYSGSVQNLPEYQSQTGRSLLILNQRPEETAPSGEQAVPRVGGTFDSFRTTLREMMDFSLLKNPVFVFIVFSNIFGMLAFYVPLVYVVNAAVLKGVPLHQATILVSVLGCANTVGRVTTGILSDLRKSNSLLMYSVCLLVSGLVTLAVPFCTTYSAFIGITLVFGLFISGFISLTSIILVDLLGLEKLTNAFGLIILFRGVAAVLGAPLAGALYDSFGSYDVPFWVAGGFFVIASGISFMVPGVRMQTG